MAGTSAREVITETITRSTTVTMGGETVTVTAPGAKETVTVTNTVTKTLTPPSELEQKYEAAKKEGSLVIYGSVDAEDFVHVKDGFTQKYPGIEITYVRGSPSEVYERFKSEVAANKPTADMLIISLPTILQLKLEGVFERYRSAELLEYPGNFFDADGFWSPVLMLPVSSVANTQLVSNVPTKIDNVLNTANKGKIIMHDLTQGTASTQMWGQMRKIIGEARWTEILERLAGLEPVLSSSLSGVTQAVRDGRYPIGLVGYLHDVVKAMEGGAPVVNFWVEDLPAMATISAAGIVKDTPHRSASELFLDYTLSEEGQTIIGNISVRFPVKPGINPKYSVDKLMKGRRLYLFPDEQVVQETDQLVETFKNMGFGA